MFDLITYPNDILKQKTKDVKKVDKDIRKIVNEMKKIMKRNNGVGLAANQIGLDISIFIAESGNKILTFINPKILKFEGEKVLLEEGCLSLPNIWGKIKRYPKVEVEYLDLFGKKKKIKAQGFLAQIIQHEIDHLNGILFAEKAEKLYKIEEIDKQEALNK
ncbi:Peptide deformylase [bacterium HR35]|nr:Peptide deformylase [bacterium HR35]